MRKKRKRDLDHSDDLAIRIFYGHAHNGLVSEIRSFVDGRIESRVLVRIDDIHRLDRPNRREIINVGGTNGKRTDVMRKYTSPVVAT